MTGRAILKALLEGRREPAEMAALAKNSAKLKIPAIIASLQNHRMTETRRFLIRHWLRQLEFLADCVAELEEERWITDARSEKQQIKLPREPTNPAEKLEIGPSAYAHRKIYFEACMQHHVRASLGFVRFEEAMWSLCRDALDSLIPQA